MSKMSEKCSESVLPNFYVMLKENTEMPLLFRWLIIQTFGLDSLLFMKLNK